MSDTIKVKTDDVTTSQNPNMSLEDIQNYIKGLNSKRPTGSQVVDSDTWRDVVKVKTNNEGAEARVVHEIPLNEIEDFIGEHDTVYELITGPCKPYYDFETYYPTREAQEERYREDFNMCFDTVKTVFPKGKIMMFDGSGFTADPNKADKPWKTSFHVRVNGAGYYSCGNDFPHFPIFDNKVYKDEGKQQLFKLPYCCKAADPTRILKRIDLNNDKLHIMGPGEIGTLGESIAHYCVTNINGEGFREGERKEVEQKKQTEGEKTNEDYDNLSLKDIKMYVKALSSKRATEYDSWRDVIWGIQHIANAQGLDLKQVARDFAKRTEDTNYSQEKTDQLYLKTNTSEKPVTFSSIIYWAKQDSPQLFVKKTVVVPEVKPWDGNKTYYDDKVKLLATNPTEEQIQQWMLGCLALDCQDGNEEWYGRFRNGWRTILRGRQLFPFTTPTSASKYLVQVPGPKGVMIAKEKQFKDCLAELVNTPAFNVCRYEKGTAWVPYFKEGPKGLLNLFDGWPHPFVDQVHDDEVKIYLDHIRMLCGSAAEYVLNWMAALIQKPTEKMPCIVLWSKEEGAGKDRICDFLIGALGKKYTLSTTDTSEVLGQFNGACEKKRVTFFNEAKEDGASIIDSQAFKSRITEVGTRVRQMYKDGRDGDNYSCYIFKTNNKHALGKVDPSDRRYVCISCCCDKVGDRAYFTKIVAAQNEEMFAKFFNWLAQRDISKFDHQIRPKTQYAEDLKVDSLASPLEHIRQICEDSRELKVAPGQPMVFTTEELYQDYRQFCKQEGIQDKYVVTQKRYKEKLVDDLSIEHGRYTTPEGRVRGFWLDYESIDKAFMKLLKLDHTIINRDD